MSRSLEGDRWLLTGVLVSLTIAAAMGGITHLIGWLFFIDGGVF